MIQHVRCRHFISESVVDKVVNNLDAIHNYLVSLKNMVQNNSITKEQLENELAKLATRVEQVSEMVGLEEADFSSLAGR